MSIIISYDIQTEDNNHRNYLRSMLERFGWNRFGGSVFRYEDDTFEDWLNCIAPSLMAFRSYVLAKGINLRFFTVDCNSTSFLDHSDATILFGEPPHAGTGMPLVQPTNNQSSERLVKDFIDVSVAHFQ